MTAVRLALRGIDNLVSQINCGKHLLRERGEEDCDDVRIERRMNDASVAVSTTAAAAPEEDDATEATGEATVAISNRRSSLRTSHRTTDGEYRVAAAAAAAAKTLVADQEDSEATTAVAVSNRRTSRRRTSRRKGSVLSRNVSRNVPRGSESPRHTDAIRNQSYVKMIEMKNRDFAEKRRFLRRKCDAIRNNAQQGNAVSIDIEIGSLLEGSLDQVMRLSRLSRKEVQAQWQFSLGGEAASGEDRFTGEWFGQVMNKLCNPNYGLWRNGAKGGEGMCLHIDPWSGIHHPDHLTYFHFMGRLMGKALLEDRQVAHHMMPHMYKCLVGADFSINDIRFLDPRYHHFIAELDQVTDFDTLRLNFTITEEVPFGGGTREMELVPGGAEKMVTRDNLAKYKEALTNYLLVGRVKTQLRAFLSGIDDAVPLAYLSVFGIQEMELLMCGSVGVSNLDTVLL